MNVISGLTGHCLLVYSGISIFMVMTNFVNSVLLEKLTVGQFTNRFFSSYGVCSGWSTTSSTRMPILLMFVTIFTLTHFPSPLGPMLSRLNRVDAFKYNLFEIYSNFILPCTPRGLLSGLIPSSFPSIISYAFNVFMRVSCLWLYWILTRVLNGKWGFTRLMIGVVKGFCVYDNHRSISINVRVVLERLRRLSFPQGLSHDVSLCLHGNSV